MLVASPALATDYFVDSAQGLDTASGTSAATAWKTLARVNLVTLSAGDRVQFKRGDTFAGKLRVRQSGTATAPISITAYGTGAAPILENPASAMYDSLVSLETVSYVIVEQLLLRDTGFAGVDIPAGSNHDVVRDCEMTNAGEGVSLSGNDNLITRVFVHDMRMVRNTPVTVNPDDDYGANGVVVGGSNNEISYSRFVRCIAPSFDYGVDGGAVEFYGTTANNFVHHNFSSDSNGFLEIGGASGDTNTGNVVSTNVVVDTGNFAYFHNAGTFAITLTGFRVEHNTIVIRNAIGAALSGQMNFGASDLLVRDNLFVTNNAVSFGRSGLTHDHNLFFRTDGSSNVGVTLDATEQRADPKFVSSTDFHLASGSPAIDQGVTLTASTDFDDAPRVSGAAVDLGAYEFGSVADAGVASDAGVTTDAGATTDAGVTSDAGVASDAGTETDAGVEEATDAGSNAGVVASCGCSSATSTSWGFVAVAGVLVLLASRRTRALRRRSLWVTALLVLSGFGFRDGPVIPVPTWLDTATGLADGRVLIAGGLDSADNSVHTAWLYEPWSGRLTAAPPMQDGHHFHSAVLLRDGRALIIAGKRTGADQGQLCEAFDPRTEQWSDAGFLTQPRERHMTTLLADGRVLNVGAFNPPWDATAELYDGTTWTAVPTPPMAIRRGEATAVRLADGQVLISGGCLDYCPAVTNLLSTSWLFNPATQVFTATTGLNAARRNHSAMMQADGGVLLIGGAQSNAAYNQLATVERLVPGSVVALPNLAQQRDAPNLFRLGDGTLAVVGGRFDAQPIELIAPDGARDAGPTQNRIRFDGAAIPAVDGRFLLAGGYINTGVVQSTMETLELRALSVKNGTSLMTGRERHTATLLPDGRVFVAGDFTAGNGTASTYEFWLPDAGVMAGGSLAVPRGAQTATLLDDQSVLLVGGSDAGDGVERCDGVTGCRVVPAPNRPRLRHASVLLHDGRVLVVGGTIDFVTDEAQLELYTPSTNTWADAGFLSVARHNPNVVVLQDGRVLVTGGYSSVGSPRVTELFDPLTGLTSTVGSSAFNHGEAPLQLLPDGRALLAGGSPGGIATTNSEVWNGDAGWSTVGSLATATASGQALLMRDNRAYVIGGATGATALTNIERFEFDNGTFDPQPALLGARYFHTATLLPTGEVLTVGGLTATGILSTTNVLRLGNLPTPDLQPVLTAPAAALVAGSSAHFTGQLLMGVGEASTGDFRSSPSEVPTLRFDWLDNHDVRHLGPTQWTATSADVTLPSTMPAGWYQVTAVVAGVSSAGVFVKVLLPDGTPCGTAGVCVSGRCGLGTCGTVAAGVDGETDGGIDGGSTNTDGGTDGGLDDGGSSTATTDGGPDGGGGMDGGDADGGPGVVHHYSVGCGCSETSGAWPALTLVALVGFRRRRR